MKPLTLAGIIAFALVLGSLLLIRIPAAPSEAPVENVRVVDGVQIVEIRAKGGYRPRQSVAAAGIPTTLRVVTDGTFDCSAALRIPSVGVNMLLPQSGATDIDLGTPAPGVLQGSCSMGMYGFSVQFK